MPGKIKILKGDITQQATDAIVNAANSSLMGGGGVDGAIHHAGGNRILEECRRIVKEHGLLPPGHAGATSGGELKAKYVIHTVGPVYKDGKHHEPEILRSCYIESLKLAVKHGVKTISFPSISTGAYHYPVDEAAPVAIKAVKDFLRDDRSIETVNFVLFDDATYAAYVKAAEDQL